MKITRVENSNIITYRGTFETNELLDKSIERADNYDLKRFRDNLSRMYNTNDDINFVLKERTQYLGAGTTSRDLVLYDKILNKYITTVGSDSTYSNKTKDTKLRFTHAIERMNNFLENLYPPQKSTCVPREILLKSITKMLSKH